jgi:3-phosphoshikimate 1-carboxyvinyltransferase
LTVAAAPASIVPASRLRGTIEPPGDKSIAHRALIVNALSGGPATVDVRAPGRDVLSTAACLRSLGVEVDAVELDGITRFSVRGRPAATGVSLDCGNSGTTMRLLAGALAGLPLEARLDGDASLRARPMERVATVLRAAGAAVHTTDGHAPLTVAGSTGLRGVTHRLPVASAQLLGVAALAGLAAQGTTRVEVPGPTRDHTERLLAAAGIPIRRDGPVTTLDGPVRPSPISLRVPGDLSSAAPWLVAAALHPDADLTITGVGLNPTRTALLDLLRRMGVTVETSVADDVAGEPVGEIRVRSGGRLCPVEVHGDEVASLIDELPLIGVLMARAGGGSVLRDAAELRVKESDRITTTVAGLRAIGADAEELPDGWRVAPGQPRDAAIATRGDHRIAIAFAVAAVAGVASAVRLDDPDCVSVSYPGFWADLAAVSA